MKEVHDLLRDLEEGEAYEAKVIKVLDIGVVVSIGFVACTAFWPVLDDFADQRRTYTIPAMFGHAFELRWSSC